MRFGSHCPLRNVPNLSAQGVHAVMLFWGTPREMVEVRRVNVIGDPLKYLVRRRAMKDD